MDFPSQYPESPAKPLAGPARSRVLARQNRTSSLKPYARPANGSLTASGSSSSLHADQDAGHSPTPATPAGKKLAPPSVRSPFSPLRVAASPIALLGSVTKMVTKPLSWLTGSSSSAQPELGIPTSSSTGSLSSLARKRAALQASIKASAQDDPEKNAPTLAARAVGERLAAGFRSRPPRDDEESQMRSPALPVPAKSSASRPADNDSSLPRSPFVRNSRAIATPSPGPSTLTRSLTSSELNGDARANTWSNKASKRTLDIAPTAPDHSMDTVSSRAREASPAVQAVHNKGYQSLRSPRSQLGYPRSSSLRPDDAMSESGSIASRSHSSYAFAYGNEVRYADSSFGLPPSNSPFQLSPRGAPRRTRASLGQSLLSDPATPGRSPRAGSVGLRATSPAASSAFSPARARENASHRRDWGGMHLAAPSAPSVGDEMMREYLSTRTLPGVNPRIRRSLGLSLDDRGPVASSAVAESVMDETESLTPSRLGKRDVDMSVDGDSERIGSTAGTPSKRRMVWHPELGFISHEELKAREPKLPSPKNEAERLLNVLESMRTPISRAHANAAIPSKAPPTNIHVPVPISDPSSSVSKLTRTNDGKASITLAPYTRALRKAKAAQPPRDQQGGMRARLKKIQPTISTSSAMEEDVDQDEDATNAMLESESDNARMENEDEEQESEPEPVKPEPIRRSRRLQRQDPDSAAKEAETPSKSVSKSKQDSSLKSALKATPLKAIAEKSTTSAAANETPKPASHRISLAAVNKVPQSTVKKDNFTVKSATDSNAPRERSSLRQGATKTSRTHQSSGKFSAWDEEDEEDDLPDANDLAKIKLPTNLFPSGFSFASSTASTSSEPEASTQSQPPPSAPASSGTGSSLLGRLGGFDTSSNNQTQDKPAEKASTPSFSFTAPSKDAPNAAPKFTFNAPTASSGDVGKNDSEPKKALPGAQPASNFFSKPAEPATKTLTDGKKDGPVPNFFGSTVQKFESKAGEISDKNSTSGASFSFGASSNAPPAEDAKKAGFSFGAPTTANAQSNGGFSFGAKPTSGEAQKETSSKESKSSFFGSSQTSSGGGFSFGAATSASSAANTGSKRGADDEGEPASKKSTPSFSFGASKPAEEKKDAQANPTNSFSFGTPSAGNPSSAGDSKSGSSSGVPNFFGAKGDTTSGGSSAPSAPSTSSGGFSFAPTKPPASTTTPGTGTGGFSFSKPEGSSSTTMGSSSAGFTFGAPKATASESNPASASSSTGFSFGSTNSSAPASGENKPAADTSGPTFTFGASKTAAATAAAKEGSASGSGSTTPTTNTNVGGGFTFGAPSAATDSKPAAAPSPSTGFSFGTPAAAASSASNNKDSGATPSFTFGGGGAGGGFGSNANASKPSGANGGSSPFPAPANTNNTSNAGGEMMDDAPAPSAPKFTFGAPAASSSSANLASTPGFKFGSTTATNGAPTSTSTTTAVGSGFGTSAAPTSSSSAPFTFGSNAAASGTTTPGVAPPPAATTGFRFGSPAPAPVPVSMSFTFGASGAPAGGGQGGPGSAAGSAPGSPFLAPTTPGGGTMTSGFSFGIPSSSSSSAGQTPGNTGTSSVAPTFQFGSSTGSNTTGVAGSTMTSGAGFTFGNNTNANTTVVNSPVPTFGGSTTPSGAANTGFMFGSNTSNTNNPGMTSSMGGGGFGSPAPLAPSGTTGFTFGSNTGIPQMPLPSTQGTPGATPGLFSMGAPPTPNSNSNSPGARQIKPLRQRRR